MTACTPFLIPEERHSYPHNTLLEQERMMAVRIYRSQLLSQ
jgi:hypothetical protein